MGAVVPGEVRHTAVAYEDVVGSVLPETAAQPLPYDSVPRSSDPVNWISIVGMTSVHAVASLAVLPMFWDLGAIVTALLATYLIGSLGISLGYHRLLTHRSFEGPKWLERTLVTLGVCCGQDSPAYWYSAHVRHHQHADESKDPHSPRSGFWWAHIGWILRTEKLERRRQLIEHYGKHLLRDPYYAWMEDYWWMLIVLASWILIFAGGVLVGVFSGYDTATALKTGLTYFIWVGCVRMVVVWHVTFAVNSVTHLWGYRNYETGDDSRNNLIVGYLSYGEGWHNNHHADPRAAFFMRRWWELDASFTAIRLLRWLGLARNVILPSKRPLQPDRP